MNNTVLLSRCVHLVLPALLSAVALAASLVDVHDFKPNVWDYGLFSNVLWNFADGNGWRMSLYEGLRPTTNFLADHFDLSIALFCLPFKFTSSPYAYACLHAAAFAGVFFMLPHYVKEVFQQNGRERYLLPAAFLLLAFCLFPGVVGAWRYQSHSTTIVMPFLLLALLCLHRKHTWAAVVCCIVVAMAQERASVAVFGVGMYAFLVLKQYRLGVALCAAATGYFFLLVKVVIPYFADSGYLYESSVNFAADWEKKLVFLAVCLAGWYFLGCCGRMALLASACALPMLAIGLISARSPMYRFVHHYQDLPSIFLLAGATFGLLKVTENRIFKKIPYFVCIGIVCCLFWISYKNFKSFNPVHRLLSRENVVAIDNVNQELQKYANLPRHIRTYASSGIGSRFALREHAYELRLNNSGSDFTSSYIFIAPNFNMYPFSKEQTATIMANLKNNQSIQPVFESSELSVFASKDLLTQNP